MQPRQGFIVGLILMLWLPRADAAQVHHALDVTLNPDTAGIEVRATVTLPDGHPPSLTFALHPALEPELQNSNARLVELPHSTDSSVPVSEQSTAISPRRYRLDLAHGENSFSLHYTGSIAHALQGRSEPPIPRRLWDGSLRVWAIRLQTHATQRRLCFAVGIQVPMTRVCL